MFSVLWAPQTGGTRSLSRRRQLSRAFHGYKYTAPPPWADPRYNTSNGACTYCHDLFFLVWTCVRDGVFSLGRQLADRCEIGSCQVAGARRWPTAGWCAAKGWVCSWRGCCCVFGGQLKGAKLCGERVRQQRRRKLLSHGYWSSSTLLPVRSHIWLGSRHKYRDQATRPPSTRNSLLHRTVSSTNVVDYSPQAFQKLVFISCSLIAAPLSSIDD
jgi:hypothetical protein